MEIYTKGISDKLTKQSEEFRKRIPSGSKSEIDKEIDDSLKGIGKKKYPKKKKSYYV